MVDRAQDRGTEGLMLPEGRGWVPAQGHECHEWRRQWPCPEPSHPGDSGSQALRRDKQKIVGSLCPAYASAITEGNKIQSSVRVSHPARPSTCQSHSTRSKGLTATREQKSSDSAENVLSGPQGILQETFPDLRHDLGSPTGSEAGEWAVRKMDCELGHCLVEG